MEDEHCLMEVLLKLRINISGTSQKFLIKSSHQICIEYILKAVRAVLSERTTNAFFGVLSQEKFI